MFTNAFNDNIKDSILFHIPHSSINIPNTNNFLIDGNELNNELIFSTDIATDKIFNVNGIKKFTCDFSRLFCDVERFIIGETMDSYGRGLYYTKTTDNKDLRKFNYNDYWNVLTNYFIPYHNNLTETIQSNLNENGSVIIIDCHSFNSKRLRYESITNRPDICLGIDEYHTPKFLIDYIKNHFESNGLIVEINTPYSGTFVPSKFYNINHNVQSIMIEINKRLYTDNDKIIIDSKVDELNTIIQSLFDF